MSRRHKGGDVQAIEYVAQHTFGVILVVNDIIDYRRRIILGPQERDGTRKPLLDPSGTSKTPKSRPISMLPAVARMVITHYDYFNGILQQVVHLLPAKIFTLHGGFSHNSSVQAPTEFPGGSCTRAIRIEPGSSSFTWRWKKDTCQRDDEDFLQTQFFSWDRYH